MNKKHDSIFRNITDKTGNVRIT